MRAGGGDVDIAVRIHGNAIGVAEAGGGSICIFAIVADRAIAGDFAYTIVAAVGDVEVALLVDGNRRRATKTRRRALGVGIARLASAASNAAAVAARFGSVMGEARKG